MRESPTYFRDRRALSCRTNPVYHYWRDQFTFYRPTVVLWMHHGLLGLQELLQAQNKAESLWQAARKILTQPSIDHWYGMGNLYEPLHWKVHRDSFGPRTITQRMCDSMNGGHDVYPRVWWASHLCPFGSSALNSRFYWVCDEWRFVGLYYTQKPMCAIDPLWTEDSGHGLWRAFREPQGVRLGVDFRGEDQYWVVW